MVTNEAKPRVVDADDDDLVRTSVCQVCERPLPPHVLDLGHQPMCDDLRLAGSDQPSVRYPIRISICPACLTAHQRFNIRKETLFPSGYHYRPRFTKDVLDGMAGLVAQIAADFCSVRGKLVCDIGCNDGSLLDVFRDAGALTCGVEPTDAAFEARANGHEIVNAYFGVEAAEQILERFGRPDIITFTNVFAHIEDLSEAIDGVRMFVTPSSLVVIENHYLGAVLDTRQFDTFYHEHPRTYSVTSFEHIAQRLAGEILSVVFPKRYGGNIRVVIGNFGGARHYECANVERPHAESRFVERLAAMQGFVDAWKAETRRRMLTLLNDGVIMHGKSFPGRAVVLITLLGLDSDLQPVIYEKPGSLKIGHEVPGTSIRIESDEKWHSGAAKPDALVVWGWHIADEIALYLRTAGFTGRIFSPMPEFHEIALEGRRA